MHNTTCKPPRPTKQVVERTRTERPQQLALPHPVAPVAPLLTDTDPLRAPVGMDLRLLWEVPPWEVPPWVVPPQWATDLLPLGMGPRRLCPRMAWIAPVPPGPVVPLCPNTVTAHTNM